MATQILSVSSPQDVSSPQALDVFLGDPPRHLLIFTGIANARWDSRGDLDRETLIIKLGRVVAQPPRDGDWTATVGLSNIANTESDFIFALDRVAALQVDSRGELQLVVDIAVQGGDSFLNSFSYQVTLLVQSRDVGLKSLLVSDNIPFDPGGIDPNAPHDPSLQWKPEATVAAHLPWRLRVELDGPAPDPGVVVSITSSNPQIVPAPVASVLIQPGHTTGGDEFLSPPAGQDPTNSAITATISATYHGQTRTALIHVTGPTT